MELEELKKQSIEIVDLKSQIEVLQKVVLTLQTEHNSLKTQVEQFLTDTVDHSKVQENTINDSVVHSQDVTVSLKEKNCSIDEYSQFTINFTFDVMNNTNKSIKGVQGTATFSDMFGVKILDLNCDFTGQTIAVNSSILVSNLVMNCNQFIDDHMKLYNTNTTDLLFNYKATAVVFTDGTVNSY